MVSNMVYLWVSLSSSVLAVHLGQRSTCALDTQNKSSKGQNLLEVHVHPSEWSIEETLSSSTPGQLENLIRASYPEQEPSMKMLSCLFTC